MTESKTEKTEKTEQERTADASMCLGAPDRKGAPPCPDCGRAHRLQPGTKSWFWAKRFEHLTLWIMPALPFVTAVTQFLRPTVNVRLTDGQEATVNRAVELSGDKASTIQRAIVDLDAPTVADRLLAAGPSLAATALLAFLSYALWRIEINMSAGKRQRPFTEKDFKFLSRAASALTWGWFVLFALELSGFGFLHFGSDVDGFLGAVGSDNTLLMLWLSMMAYSTRRIYAKGAKAYADLEKIV